jgi:hypothetical protein
MGLRAGGFHRPPRSRSRPPRHVTRVDRRQISHSIETTVARMDSLTLPCGKQALRKRRSKPKIPSRRLGSVSSTSPNRQDKRVLATGKQAMGSLAVAQNGSEAVS